MVVYDIGHVVSRHAVGLQQYLVVQLGGVESHFFAYSVGKQHRFAVWHFEPDDVGYALGHGFFYFIGFHREAVAHLHAGTAVVLEGDVFLAGLFEFLGGVKSVVGIPLLDELLGVLLVNILALGLPVGAVVAAKARPFVRLHTQPFQGVDNVFLRPGHVARLVGVLNAQDESATVLAGQEVIVQSGAYPADMKRTGGAGGKTKPNVVHVI